MNKVQLSTIWMLTALVILTSCANKNEVQINSSSSGWITPVQATTQEQDETTWTGSEEIVEQEAVEEEVLEVHSTNWSRVTLNDIKEWTTITSWEIVIWTVSVDWYKDSEFPISLIAENGTILATSTASGEVIDEQWNPTGDNVQYVAELIFEVPEGVTKATLKLESANSGDFLEIPVSL